MKTLSILCTTLLSIGYVNSQSISSNPMDELNNLFNKREVQDSVKSIKNNYLVKSNTEYNYESIYRIFPDIQLDTLSNGIIIILNPEILDNDKYSKCNLTNKATTGQKIYKYQRELNENEYYTIIATFDPESGNIYNSTLDKNGNEVECNYLTEFQMTKLIDGIYNDINVYNDYRKYDESIYVSRRPKQGEHIKYYGYIGYKLPDITVNKATSIGDPNIINLNWYKPSISQQKKFNNLNVYVTKDFHSRLLDLYNYWVNDVNTKISNFNNKNINSSNEFKKHQAQQEKLDKLYIGMPFEDFKKTTYWNLRYKVVTSSNKIYVLSPDILTYLGTDNYININKYVFINNKLSSYTE